MSFSFQQRYHDGESDEAIQMGLSRMPSPLEKLAGAMLRRGLLDLGDAAGPYGEKEDAFAWFRGETLQEDGDFEHPFTFENCCDILGMNPSVLLSKVEAFFKSTERKKSITR